MPQGPLLARDVADATGFLYNITAATALRTTGGARLVSVSVVVTSTGAGGAFDAAATGTGTAGRQIAAIPATVGVYPVNWPPCQSGIVIVPGTGQTLACTLG